MNACVVLVRPPAVGGLLSHVRMEARILAERGITVIDAAPPDAPALGVPGVTSVTVPIREALSPLHSMRALVRLHRLMRAPGVHVAHAHGVRAGALACIASHGTGVSVVVTLHNAPPHGGAVRWIGRLLHRIVARSASHVLAVSPDLQALIEHYGATSVQRGLIPAEPARSRPAHTTTSDVAAQAQRTPELTCLVLARLAPQKGLDDLIDALSLIPDQPIRVLVAGEGPLRAHIEQRVADTAAPITLLGHRCDTSLLLEQCDVVVQSSVWEGQPVALQEALQAGKAIVATDAGGTRWVVEDAALIVPARDPRAIAHALRALIDDHHSTGALRRDLEARAQQRARRLPTREELSKQLEQVLKLRP